MSATAACGDEHEGDQGGGRGSEIHGKTQCGKEWCDAGMDRNGSGRAPTLSLGRRGSVKLPGAMFQAGRR
jgi:hypothetical protein